MANFSLNSPQFHSVVARFAAAGYAAEQIASVMETHVEAVIASLNFQKIEVRRAETEVKPIKKLRVRTVYCDCCDCGLELKTCYLGGECRYTEVYGRVNGRPYCTLCYLEKARTEA